MQVTVKQRQTIVDIALQYLGDADELVTLALLNGIDINDVAAGTALKLPTANPYKQSVIEQFNDVNAPASALTTPLVDDSWAIYWGEYE